MSPAMTRTLTSSSKKPLIQAETTEPQISPLDLDQEDTRITEAIYNIEADPEKRNLIKAAALKIQDAIRQKSPEEREEIRKRLAAMDGASYSVPESEQAQANGTAKKKGTKRRYFMWTGVSGLCLGLTAGAIMALPVIALPVLAVIIFPACAIAAQHKAFEAKYDSTTDQTPSDGKPHDVNRPPARNI